MGLDIYAGSLTRYYSRNWKNRPQQWAEANGVKCVMTDAHGNEIKPVEDKAEIMRIQDAVCQWARTLFEYLGACLPDQLWKEAPELGYFTDKPDWEAYGALIMLLACHLQNRPLPEYVEKGWRASDDAVVKESMAQKSGFSLLSEVNLWLPIDEMSIFTTNKPTGDVGPVSTLIVLKGELEEINRRIWGEDEATIKSWRLDKYYTPLPVQQKKSLFSFLRRKKATEKYRTEDLAQAAFSILYEAVNFAIEHKVPLLLDY